MTAEVELFQGRPPAVAGPAALAIPGREDIDSWVTVASDVIKLADYICETSFVPKAYRDNPHAVAAAILAGRELGLPPMTALRHVQVVEGSPSLSAEYKRARVLAAGHDLDILELSTTRCRVSGKRRGSGKPPLEITFTIDDAKRAGLVKQRGAWETRPRRMLFARASTEVCDFLFADITNGLPTAELLVEGTVEDAFEGYAESPGQPAIAAAPAAAQRTAQRRRQPAGPAPATGQPAGHEPAAGPVPTSAPTAGTSGASTARTGTADGLPPLPGEDDPVPPTSPAAPEHGSTDSGPTDTDRDADGSVTKPQLTKLGAIFTEYGFKNTAADRELRLGVASTMTGRDLQSSSELSLNEASALIDTLENCGSRDNLMALLAATPSRTASEIREDSDG